MNCVKNRDDFMEGNKKTNLGLVKRVNSAFKSAADYIVNSDEGDDGLAGFGRVFLSPIVILYRLINPDSYQIERMEWVRDIGGSYSLEDLNQDIIKKQLDIIKKQDSFINERTIAFLRHYYF